MTRKIKYAQKRANIEMENLVYMFKHYEEYFNMLKTQKSYKREMGYKH